MNLSKTVQVMGRDGELGVIDPAAQPKNEPDVLIRLNNGKMIQVPADLLVLQEDGRYYLPMSLDQFEVSRTAGAETLMVIPVVVEELEVDRRKVTRGKIRVHKRVHEREEWVDEPTFEETVDVKRVELNEVVDSPPPVRYEGDTLVIPLLEEVLVIEKRLLLKGEVRVTRLRQEVRKPQRVTLRSEDVEVENIGPEDTNNHP